ncbi:MAG: caspase family protein [Pseudomonadota bacterium]
MMRTLLGCMAVLGCVPAFAEDRALLIGISDYAHVEPLDGPINDVAIMRDLAVSTLGFTPDQVKVLGPAETTRAGVLGALNTWIIDGTQPGDRVLLYYSGHGTQIDDTNGDEGVEGRDEALVMRDFQPGNGEVITDDELADLLDRLADRMVTFVVDACHSGTVARSLTPETSGSTAQARFVPYVPTTGNDSAAVSRSGAARDDDLRRDSGVLDQSGTGRQHEIWSSAAAYQLAWETQIDGAAHGVFTHAFAQALGDGLADANGNGHVSREEVLAYIHGATEAFCADTEVCAGQTPELEAPPASRALAVVEWPDDSPDPGGNPEPEPDNSGPTIAQILDVITGGRRDVGLVMDHFDPNRTGSVQRGDNVVFEITSGESGEVLLFDLRNGGVVHQLFPSTAFAKNTPILSEGSLRVPDAYAQVAFPAPPGEGTLVALVVHDRGLVDRLAQQNRDLKPIPDPMAFFGSLMAELNGTYHDDTENRKVQFGKATYPYSIQ